MEFLLISFVAGVLSALAPCVLPLMPIVLGGTVGHRSKLRPLIVTTSLGLSIIVFTLLLKASTLLIAVPPQVWTGVSGGILIAFGLVTVFPRLWQRLVMRFKIGQGSSRTVVAASRRRTHLGPIIMGAALGPVFASCSPTYAVIVATVLPKSPLAGLVYLIAYSTGLALVLLLIAYFGQGILARFKWALDPEGLFRRSLGVVFIIVGLAVITGSDKATEAYLLQHHIFDTTKLDGSLISR